MPWRDDKSLPTKIKRFATTAKKKRAFREVFERAQEEYGDESTAWAVAYAAAKKAGGRRRKKSKKKKVVKSFRDYCQEYYG